MAKTTKATDGKKTECPVSKEQFVKEAKPQAVSVGEGTVILSPKQFATGSFGWHGTEKVVVMVGDVPVKCQANVILTAVGSKPEGK